MYTISHEERCVEIEEGPEGWYVAVYEDDGETSAPRPLRTLGPSENFYLALGVALRELSGKEGL